MPADRKNRWLGGLSFARFECGMMDADLTIRHSSRNLSTKATHNTNASICCLFPAHNPAQATPPPRHAPALSRHRSTPAPHRSFFGTLFRSLGSLAIVEAILSNIIKDWAFIHPRHQRNLALAQHAVNVEWQEYHSSEWEERVRRAEFQALMTYAEKKPVGYSIMLPLKCKIGSVERRLYNGILRKVNKEFYEEYKDVLGEAMGEKELQKLTEAPPEQAVETESE
jgi:hypothetical protein